MVGGEYLIGPTAGVSRSQRKLRPQTGNKFNVTREPLIQKKPFEGNLAEKKQKQGLATSSMLHSNNSLNLRMMQQQIAPPSEVQSYSNNNYHRSSELSSHLPKNIRYQPKRSRQVLDPYTNAHDNDEQEEIKEPISVNFQALARVARNYQRQESKESVNSLDKVNFSLKKQPHRIRA